ncbi:MBL fold metallo-hydrolase [Thermoclostridium stercorarium subsp. thermolacticum DSM 2910]|uniref:MBL fold metallo-hydrolase n=1 Tax=Thermoclostridium stercorarium subsp. thermolacticum DSM 2910 TaxID=1121336 RepID=A0A1B1YAA4_THEST|nr:MBL fold metallo-hydrolase [Thermoclostridium stercorarium subsp. thermolacticum DSM 2910]
MIDIQVLASGSKGNCYRVTDGSTPLLLECGIPYKEIQKTLNFRVSEIAGCLVSHEHQDHAKAIKDIMKAGIDCYMSRGTAEALGISGHRLNIIKAKQQFRIGTWAILPFETQHDAVEPVGFLLANSAGEKLLYATDTYYIRYRFKGLTHVMVECNYSLDILRANVEAGVIEPVLKNRILKSHFSLENVKEFLKANDLGKVQEIWLLHLSDNNSDSERFKREVMELTGKPVYIALEKGEIDAYTL